MATTISQGFAQLKSNLEITDPQTETVSGRQNAVRKAVEDEMTVLDSFLTGSYSRSTLIAPLSQADVDIFVVLDTFHGAVRSASAIRMSITGRW
jgi:tRNA nucleotidyltransferase (CCA-adding enzyme)